MPSNPIGYSFAPTFENAEIARQGGAAGSQPQTPLQVLSYRLRRSPAVLGMSPLSTDQSSGVGNSSVIESVLRTVLGPEAAREFLASLQSGAADFDQPTAGGGASEAPVDSGPGNPFAPPRRGGGASGGGGAYERPSRSGGGGGSPFGGTWSSGGPGVQYTDNEQKRGGRNA